MSWTLLGIVVLAHVLAILVLRQRQVELARIKAGLAAIEDAKRKGSHKARLQFPHIDRSNCIGCATCIAACPEEGVLDLVHGQAMVVHGARCVGCGNCATECPVGAIALTLGDVSERDDLPVVTDEWESNRVPGLFLGGEVTGYALIRTAIEHGKAIANVVADRLRDGVLSPEVQPRWRDEGPDPEAGAMVEQGFWAHWRERGAAADTALPRGTGWGPPGGPAPPLATGPATTATALAVAPAHPVPVGADRSGDALVSVASALEALSPGLPALPDIVADQSAVSRMTIRGAVALAARDLRRPDGDGADAPAGDSQPLVLSLAPPPPILPAVAPDAIQLDHLVAARTALFDEDEDALPIAAGTGHGGGLGSGGGGGDGGGNGHGDGSGDGSGHGSGDSHGHGFGHGNGHGANDPAPDGDEGVYDLCIVGAGPAGLACSLQAKARGLSFVTLEQEQLGGTVAKYPRRKLVMTQPVDLPLHGPLKQTTYTKEELMELWQSVATEQELPIRTGVQFEGVERAPDGHLVVNTRQGTWHARNVCLALGRRGTPRKLGVPGEHLPKVAYNLMDAESYQGRRILVVGGGDSAVEAALGLAAQPGNQVTLSYRQAAFSRLKGRNEAHLQRDLDAGRLTVMLESNVLGIEQDAVVLRVGADTLAVEQRLPNDEVFVMAGGVPPFELLQRAGVSFDSAERPAEPPLVEQGTGLRRALSATLAMSMATLLWVLCFLRYYALDASARHLSSYHDLLAPSGVVGLTCGILGTALILVNLAYLARRARWGRRLPGSLRGWMTTHMVTGIVALLLLLVHAGMVPGNSLGGHAFLAIAVLVVTGAIGRYFYAFVPHAANGRELAIDEVRNRLAALSAAWDEGGQEFGARIRADVEQLVDEGRWRGSFIERLGMLLKGQRQLSVALSRLRADARAEGLPADQVTRLVALARSAHRSALMSAHYEELRALLNTWRYLHRWMALLMVLLAGWHIVTSLRYGALFG